jgi:Skp family chaperone for outer membrane proteins
LEIVSPKFVGWEYRQNESLLKQENLTLQQEITKYQEELQRPETDHQKELQKLKDESKSSDPHDPSPRSTGSTKNKTTVNEAAVDHGLFVL